MDSKKDTLILELIKYLVNSEKPLPQEVSSSAMQSNIDLSEIVRIQQQTNRKIEELKNSLDSLREELRNMVASQNGNGHSPASATASPPAEGLQEQILKGYLEASEEKLQSFFPVSCVLSHQAEFFLWVGQWKNRIALVILQAENNAISHPVLTLMGSEALLSLKPDSEEVEDFLLQLNRKIVEFYLLYPSLPQKIRVAVCLVEKREAKVLFGGAKFNLLQLSEEGFAVYEGNKSYLGPSLGSISPQSASIKRGTTFLLYAGNVSTELEKLLKKIAEEPLQEKKNQLSKWLAKKNSSEVIVGFGF